MRACRFLIALMLGAVALGAGRLRAGPIAVPGGSFESPQTPYVSINVDAWQKTPKPDDYVEGGGFLWTQLAGIFKNTPVGSADHIDNCNGLQALWLFAVPGVGVFQDYDSTDWNGTAPTHAFDARFEVGCAYTLTSGVIGGGGNMREGVSLELALYCRDDHGNPITVAATNVVFTRAIFPVTTRFVDCQARLATVRTDDPWAGRHIGVRLRSSITDTNLAGGYWDVDNIRLSAVAAPLLQSPRWQDGRFEFTLLSEPGSVVELLASTNVLEPLSEWTSLGLLTNTTGATRFVDARAPVALRFYQARQVP